VHRPSQIGSPSIRASASGIDVSELKPLFEASAMAIDIYHTS
jgi:hypothetical protein